MIQKKISHRFNGSNGFLVNNYQQLTNNFPRNSEIECKYAHNFEGFANFSPKSPPISYQA